MNFNIDLNTLIGAVILAVLVFGIKGIFAMRDHLARLNGRLGRAEMWREEHEKQADVWREQHEKQDDERYGSLKMSLTTLWDELRKLVKSKREEE